MEERVIQRMEELTLIRVYDKLDLVLKKCNYCVGSSSTVLLLQPHVLGVNKCNCECKYGMASRSSVLLLQRHVLRVGSQHV